MPARFSGMPILRNTCEFHDQKKKQIASLLF
uniref:Uncharacterized protein n=1 Tax=Rhizophora mucronata TaxID=61149 RepID=A0A2P2JPZ4_RHIMU